MGSKHVRLDDDVYAKIEDKKHGDETFSEAIDRLTSDWSLAEWAQKYPVDTEETEKHREMLEELEEIDRQESENLLERLE